jgi:Cys-rich protein (TIGR01571 family)
MSAEWQHSLFGCFSNCGVCVVTYFVPCYTAGKVAEKVGDSCVLCGLVLCVPIAGCICGAVIRSKVRGQKNIPGSIFGDMVAWWCCPCCALVQESLEMDAIGSSSMANEGEPSPEDRIIERE